MELLLFMKLNSRRLVADILRHEFKTRRGRIHQMQVRYDCAYRRGSMSTMPCRTKGRTNIGKTPPTYVCSPFFVADADVWALQDAYQPSPIPYPTQLFKAIGSTPDASTSTASAGHSDDELIRSPYAARLRYGRGGRLYLDRRMLLPEPGRAVYNGEEGDVEEEERIRRLHERWRFDRDDEFVDPDERDRVLVNDLDPRYVSPLLAARLETDD